jgi:hypothetical protein
MEIKADQVNTLVDQKLKMNQLDSASLIYEP